MYWEVENGQMASTDSKKRRFRDASDYGEIEAAWKATKEAQKIEKEFDKLEKQFRKLAPKGMPINTMNYRYFLESIDNATDLIDDRYERAEREVDQYKMDMEGDEYGDYTSEKELKALEKKQDELGKLYDDLVDLEKKVEKNHSAYTKSFSFDPDKVILMKIKFPSFSLSRKGDS